MSEPTPPRHSARETRLLLITLAVSVAALLLLARFRFPERPIADLSPPQPLTRLTRVTAFDELSAMLRDLLRQFEGAVVSVRLAPAAGEAATPISTGFVDDVRTRGAEPLDRLGLVVADDLALVPLSRDVRVVRVAGSSVGADVMLARDEERGLAVVRVPGHSAPELPLTPSANPLGAPGYVAILEAAADGPTIRAEFVSRASRETHAAWDVPVLALGGAIRAQPGAFLFTLNGRFVGMTLDDPDRTLVVPAEPLLARAARLSHGENILIVDSGLGIQPLTPALAKATGASAGVIVNAVRGSATARGAASAGETATVGDVASASRPSGARRGAGAGTAGRATVPQTAVSGATVEVGDVITAVSGQPIRSPREWQHLLRTPGVNLDLTIVRLGKRLQVSWTLPGPADSSPARAASALQPAPAQLSSLADAIGLLLRSVPGAGRGVEVIDVHAVSPAARAGLHAGDVITALPGRGAATLQNISTAYAELTSGQALLVAIDRHGTAFVTAIEKP